MRYWRREDEWDDARLWRYQRGGFNFRTRVPRWVRLFANVARVIFAAWLTIIGLAVLVGMSGLIFPG